MKHKKRLTIAAAVFAGINVLIFIAAMVLAVMFKNNISNFIIEWAKSLGTESDFGYWLNNSIAVNLGVIMLMIIIILFLLIVAKFAIFVHFVKYARFGIKDFYTRRSKYTLMVIFQILLVGTFFGMFMGLLAIVVQKALVTPERLEQVLNDTWSNEDPRFATQKDENGNTPNRPVVVVGPNKKFVENISQLRDSARYLEEAGLISKGQRNALNKKIDKLSKDRAKKAEMRGK
jgi:hypothetical protein